LAMLEGQQVGSYRLLRQVGWGGFGAVYEGKRFLSNQRWAIKILQQQHFNDRTSRDRFLREAQTQSILNHPHIVPVNDYGFDRNWAYLAMPLVEGGTLQEILNAAVQQGRSLDLDQIYYYLKQICLALDYAHGQNVVHLDIKPANLLVRYDGHLLLTDFGLAHFMAGEALRTGSNEQAGTPEYMAPERWTGDPVKHSDIYAVGIVLYQMLTGRVPFKEANFPRLMQRHIHDPVPPLSASRPMLPKSLEPVLSKALAKDPKQRYASAGDLQKAFSDACPNLQDYSIPHRSYGFKQGGVTAAAPQGFQHFLGSMWARVKRVPLPRATMVPPLQTINWSTFGLSRRKWFPRIVWGLPPLLFVADLLVLPIVAGLWFQSWWVLGAALLVPLLVLSFAGIASDSKRRFLAFLGAVLCGGLWAMNGWVLGTVFHNPGASLGVAALAGLLNVRLHVEAFPAQGRFIDSQAEARYWRWWLLGTIAALGLPLVLGIVLHSPNTFGIAALFGAMCVLFSIIADKRAIALLWNLTTFLLLFLWGSVGWVLGIAARGSELVLANVHLPLLALAFAGTAALVGFFANHYVFFRRPLNWPNASQFRVLALVMADLLALPLFLGLWYQSWVVCWVSLASLLVIFWLVRLGYRQRSGFPKKHLPTVFGVFLASVIWASAVWAISLLVPLPHFLLVVSILRIQGSWLSVLLALVAFLACSPIHLRFFPITQRSGRGGRDRKTVRVWVVCALDLIGLPLLFYLAQRTQWSLTLSIVCAFALLLLAVITDIWEEPGVKYLIVLLSASFWAFAGWVLGSLMTDVPSFSLPLGDALIENTWAALALAVVFFSIGWPLHVTNFSKR
jgi:serine/threonine protein kinase